MDDFIGKRFGKDGHLEILYVSGKKRYSKVYAAICHICKLDTELFGDGTFHRVKSDFVAGNIPCGCSKNVKWTRNQYEILCKRRCKEVNYTFLSFVCVWRGKWTPVSLRCDKGHLIQMSMNNFLYGYNCKRCRTLKTIARCTHDYGDEVNSFFASGKIPEGTIFSKSDKLTSQSHSTYWDYKCGICSNDEYVKAGVCTGIFTSVAASLKKGMLACRCGVWHKWDQPKRKYQIESRILRENLDIKFSHWENDKFSIYDTIWLECFVHGTFKSTVGSFLHSETGCPKCTRTGYNKAKPAIFYILKVEGEYSKFTGYGISGNIEFRMKTHVENLKEKGYYVVDQHCVSGSGDMIFNLESSVKKLFKRNPQDVLGFKKEATDYSEYSNLITYAVNYIKEKA